MRADLGLIVDLPSPAIVSHAMNCRERRGVAAFAI
jgi:hypothetical protein